MSTGMEACKFGAEEEDLALEKEESDDDSANEDEPNDVLCPTMVREPSRDKVHHSGVPFPLELLSRFQEDLSKQDHFKDDYKKIPGKNCYGAGRPQMSLNLRSEDEDRKLVVLAAWFYNEVKKKGKCQYMHHHHPDWFGHEGGYGVDCSNFTSHLYNLCLGVRFTSAIKPQAQMDLPKVTTWSALRPGDLAFFSSKVGHVGICVEGKGNPSVIHSTSARINGHSGPTLTSNHDGWPIKIFSHGLRFEDVRRKGAAAAMRTQLQQEHLSPTELRRQVLDAGVHQEHLDKAVDEAVYNAMVELIVDVALSKGTKKTADMEVDEEAASSHPGTSGGYAQK